MSMVCGDVTVHLTESRTEACMPRLKILFFVMTMDKNGHVVWPTDFGNKKKAQLREQARQLLKQMIDDPLSPVNETMEPAMTGTGTSEVWKASKKRKLVESGQTWEEGA